MAVQFLLAERDAPRRAPDRPSRQHFALDDQRHGLTRRSVTSGVETRVLKPVSGYPLTIPGTEIPETLDLSGVCYRALAGGDPFANLRRWAAAHTPLRLTWTGDRGRPFGDLWLVVQIVENDEMYLEGLWQVRRWRLQLTRIPAAAAQGIPAPTPVPPEEAEDFGPLPEPTGVRLNPVGFGVFLNGYVLLRWSYASDKVDFWEYRYGPAGGDYGSPIKVENPAARSLTFQYHNSGGLWFYTPLQLQLAAGTNSARQTASDWVDAPVFYQPALIPGVQYAAANVAPNPLTNDAVIIWDERPVEDSGVAFTWQHRVWAVGSPNPTAAAWRPVAENRYIRVSNLRIPDPANPRDFLPLTSGVDYYFQVRAISQARPALHDPGGLLIAYGRTKFTAE